MKRCVFIVVPVIWDGCCDMELSGRGYQFRCLYIKGVIDWISEKLGLCNSVCGWKVGTAYSRDSIKSPKIVFPCRSFHLGLQVMDDVVDIGWLNTCYIRKKGAQTILDNCYYISPLSGKALFCCRYWWHLHWCVSESNSNNCAMKSFHILGGVFYGSFI